MAEIGFELQVDHDELEARLLAVNVNAESIITRQALTERLRAENVHAGIDEAMIEEAFARLIELEEPGAVFVIARGTHPRHGKNGDIQFKVDVSGRASYRASEADDDTIDFREATTVTSVAPGEVVAELIPPTKGEPGVQLSGKTIAARDGKPASIRLGEGIELTPDGLYCKSTQQGRPVYSAGVLSVSPIYEVSGDVDFNTGNIKFDGHVVVSGNVQDDFAIEANSIEIRGVIGAAKIVCKGDLRAAGGINGRDKVDIRVDGIAHCKYINQAEITVLGDLVVNREIVNSRVWCRGKVKAEKIIGGRCVALAGIEAKYLGSEMGVNTVLEPGRNFEILRLDEKMARVAERIEPLLRPIEPFFGDRKRFKALPDDKKNDFHAAYKTFTSLKEIYLELSAARTKLLSSSEFNAVRQVVAFKQVHADIFVRTDLCMRQFKKPITGPVALVEDVDASTIRARTYVPGKGVIEEEEDED